MTNNHLESKSRVHGDAERRQTDGKGNSFRQKGRRYQKNISPKIGLVVVTAVYFPMLMLVAWFYSLGSVVALSLAPLS